jgi:hypothetical protein
MQECRTLPPVRAMHDGVQAGHFGFTYNHFNFHYDARCTEIYLPLFLCFFIYTSWENTPTLQ